MASRSYAFTLAAVLGAAAAPALADDAPLFERSATGAWVQTTSLVSPAPWNFSVNELGALGAAFVPAAERRAAGAVAVSLADDVLAEDQPRLFERVADGRWAPARRAPAQATWEFSANELGAIGAAAWRAAPADPFVAAAAPRATFAAAYDADWGDMFTARATLSPAGRAAFAAAFDAFWAAPRVEALTPATAYATSYGRGGATPATAYALFLGRGGATPATAYAPAPAEAPLQAFGPPAPASERLDFSFGGLHLGSIFSGGWMARGRAEEIEPMASPAWEEIWREDAGAIGTATIPVSPIGAPLPPQTPRDDEWGLD